MKKQLLALAALLSVSIPLAANAADFTDGHRLVIHPEDSYTYRYSENEWLDLKPLHQDLIPVTQNVAGVNTMFYIKNPNPEQEGRFLGVISEPEGKAVSFEVENPTEGEFYFTVPQTNQKAYVPQITERSVVVDTASLPKGTPVAFHIENAAGEQVATGYLINGEVMQEALSAGATDRQHAQWSQTLNQLIAANEYRPPVIADDEPPVRNRTPRSTAGKYVRGYW
ncbi:MAG: hypothetical protein AB7P76_05025 [Candidatus Melainabacteria bacterium]